MGIRVQEKMFLDDGKTAKGVRHVLQEGNLWNASLSLDEARIYFLRQLDFAEQKEWLVETLSDAGCAVDYLLEESLRVQLHSDVLAIIESMETCPLHI